MMTANIQPKILVFLGSVRPGRMSDRVGKLVVEAVKSNGLEPIVFDPAEMPFEMVKVPMHFMAKPAEEAPEWMREADEQIRNADGYIIVSSEYNCGVPPALANMLDHFAPASFRNRPCGLVTYSMGTFGGVRASTLLRPLASELGMITVPSYVPIPTVHQLIDEAGNCNLPRITDNLTKLVKEVSWYARAIKAFKETEALP